MVLCTCLWTLEKEVSMMMVLIERLVLLCTFTYYYAWNAHDHVDPLERWRCLIIVYDMIWLCTIWYDYVWYVMTMVVLLCWMKGYSHEHITNIMWKVYSHVDDSKVKGHSYLMNLWAIMICWFECLVHFLMTMNLSKDLRWLFKGIMLSTERVWKWDGSFYVRKSSFPLYVISWNGNLLR